MFRRGTGYSFCFCFDMVHFSITQVCSDQEPGIHFVLFSSNSKEATEQLNKEKRTGKNCRGRYTQPWAREPAFIILSLWEKKNSRPEEECYIMYSSWISEDLDYVLVNRIY